MPRYWTQHTPTQSILIKFAQFGVIGYLAICILSSKSNQTNTCEREREMRKWAHSFFFGWIIELLEQMGEDSYLGYYLLED